LVEQLRHAIAAHRALGANPTVLALSPEDAANLDLATDGNDSYIFSVSFPGSSSGVWALQVRESPSISDPTLIDPTLAITYTGTGSVLVDPFSGMGKNLVDVRCEVELTAHVRSATAAYVIST
jgi:hypothetical protein